MADEKRQNKAPDNTDRIIKARRVAEARTSAETDRLGREQQRRALAYARTRGAAVSSFSYNEHDFSPCVTAELLEPVGHVVGADVAEVPGRPGAVLLAGKVEPLTLRLRAFMDNHAFTTAELAEVRRLLRVWLLATDGGVLVVPGEPTLEWHDAMCTGVSDWSSLFADWSAVVTFTCYDPIAYGESKESTEATFEVGGTWATWPTVSLVAEAGSSVSVGDGSSSIMVKGAFASSDAVAINMEGQTVAVNGSDATSGVTLGSDFFALSPGSNTLAFSGCSSHTVSWVERWA